MSQTKAQLIAGTASQDVIFDDAQVSSLNGGPLAGFRNRIINGNFDIAQRGGTVSQETSSLPTGSRYAWKFVASASNSFLQMGQQIEYGNCIDFPGTSNRAATALTDLFEEFVFLRYKC
jgi:hypothetical protein